MNGLGGFDGLRDIRELDAVSWWPLAPGWWIVLATLAVIALLALWLQRHPPQLPLGRPRDWRVDARRLLRDLRRRLPGLDARNALTEFSELMRRIAMARTARDVCAGLAGSEWLQWLSDHDPVGFDWKEYGRLLTEVPYAPPGVAVDMDDLRRLLDAAGRWVDPPREAAAPPELKEAA